MHVNQRNSRRNYHAVAHGFTLLEVLIALVVTSVGLLGIAKMQALAFASTSTASVRALVAIEAASLASAMRVNRTYWGSTGPGTWGTPYQIVITNNNGTVSIDDSTLNSTDADSTFSNNLCSGGGAPCTTAVLAASDLHIWASALNSVVPNTTTTISCSETLPSSCTITIMWSEKTVAVNVQGNSAPNVGISSPSYTLYVEP